MRKPMTLKQAVSQYFEPQAIELGFICTEKQNDLFWFKRKVGYAEDRIEIDKSGWNHNSLRITLSVDNASISGTKLIGQGVHGWFTYENEAAIPELLKKFADILLEYGLAWFDENRPVLMPLEERVLEKYRDSVIDPFIRKYELDLDDPGCLERLDLQVADRTLLKKQTLAVAFVLGESLIRRLGGRWVYNELNEPCVAEIGGMPNFRKNVYHFAGGYVELSAGMSLGEYFEAMSNVVKRWKKPQ